MSDWWLIPVPGSAPPEETVLFAVGGTDEHGRSGHMYYIDSFEFGVGSETGFAWEDVVAFKPVSDLPTPPHRPLLELVPRG